MSGIVELLKAFDRKERAWLVRMALKPAALDQGFLDKVSEALKLEPKSLTPDAWWGIDYHIDWLAAALHAFKNGLSVGQLTDIKDVNTEGRSKPIIEDFDFIIADEKRIILIEAKAFGDWDNEQLESKMARLAKLSKEPENGSNGQPENKQDGSAEGTNDGKVINLKNNHSVQLHMVLTSIAPLPERLTKYIPKWALLEGKPAYIKLSTTIEGHAKKIVRWDKTTKKPSKDGKTWKIIDETDY